MIGIEDVYNMEVEKHHNFSTNGLIIHNSVDSFGYGLLSYHSKKTEILSPKVDIKKLPPDCVEDYYKAKPEDRLYLARKWGII